MSLIPIKKDEIEIGKPLPWTVFDPQRNRLAAAGEVIQTTEHLLLLLDSHPCREPIREPGSNVGELSDKEINTVGQHTYPFAEMNLKVGDRLQIQPPAQLSPERFIVKLIGYLNNVSLLVTAPFDANGQHLQLIEGENLVVRVFASQNAFGFSCTIEKICRLPFDYLHLSFPSEVQGMVIRKSPRVRTKIIASVSTDQVDSAPAIIANLSATGAMLDARRELAQKGDFVKLSFRVNLHNTEAYLTVNTVVRAVFTDETLDGGAVFTHHGLEFVDLPANDRMILQSMIYQQMIEHPQTLV
ncbi:MAG: flagellar brake protein [Planctomycetota bacterium]